MKRYLIYLIPIGVIAASCNGSDNKPTTPSTETVKTDPYQKQHEMIREGFLQLKDGDLITRNGQELTSQMIRTFNRKDKTYSHAGVVIFENGYPYIYHSLMDERGARMFRDSLDYFCNPRKNFGFGIYRYDFDSTELTAYKKFITDCYTKSMPFDMDFDYTTDDKLYCSEMIAKALQKATRNRIKVERTKPTESEAQYYSTKYHKPLDKIRALQIVSIDNLYLTPDCKKIQQYQYPLNQ